MTGDRLHMPSAMPADAAERLSDVGNLHDQADKATLQQAREDLAERLKDGKSVGRLGLQDLLLSDLQGERCEIAAQDAVAIFLAQPVDRELLLERRINETIERYLETHTDLVEERAYEIMADRDEDYEHEFQRPTED